MNEYMKMLKQLEFRKQTEEAKFEAFALMCEKVADLEKEKCELLGIIQGKDKVIKDLEQKLEQTEKDLIDYQFNYPKIKDLEKQIEKMKCCENCKRYKPCVTCNETIGNNCDYYSGGNVCNNWEIKE